MKKVVSAALACLLCVFTSFAGERYQFFHITSEDGLPNNAIFCFLQDHLGFMWIGTRDGLCRYDGNSIRIFDGDSIDSSINGIVMSLCEDRAGNIWYASSNGLGYYNPETDKMADVRLDIPDPASLEADSDGWVWMTVSGKVYKYRLNDNRLVSYDLDVYGARRGLCKDSDGRMYILARGSRIARYVPESDSFEFFEILQPEEQESGERVSTIESGFGGCLAVTTNYGRLLRFDPRTSEVEPLTGPIGGGSGFRLHCSLPVSAGQCWVATSEGVYIYDSDNGLQGPLLSSPDDASSLSSSDVRSLYLDRDGNIWLGTYFAGVDLYRSQRAGEAAFSEKTSSYSIQGSVVRAIAPDVSGDLWIGTEDGGFNRVFARNLTTESYGKANGIPEGSSIHALACVGDKVWVLTYDSGVLVFNPSSKKVESVKRVEDATARYECLLVAENGDIFLGTTRGLYKYNPSKDCFAQQTDFESSYIHSLYQDSFGTLWAGTYGRGLYRKDLKAFDSKAELIEPGDSCGLSSGYITSCFEDHRHLLWVTTMGGGICYVKLDNGNRTFSCFSRRDGLPTNITCAATEDKDGMLWISTSKGLVQFDPEAGTVKRVLLNSNASIGNQYSYGACYSMSNGLVYMGTTGGLISFYPDRLAYAMGATNIYITEILCGKGLDKNPLPEGTSALNASVISLSYKDASLLRLTFASLDYSDTQEPLFRYTLSRRNKVIDAVTTDNTIMLTDLRSGVHHLDIRPLGAEEGVARRSLTIKVGYQPLCSPLAYICYGLILAGAFTAIQIRKRRNREYEKMRLKEKMEEAKQKEIQDAKINFFTNITHELRTPLTLIKMPIERIIRDHTYKEQAKDDILTIQDNTNRLIQLTGQLLDLRKLENSTPSLVYLQEDLCALVRKSCATFEPVAKERGIALKVDLPDTPVETMCAAEAVRKIVDNLMSNAIKYTKDRIDVSLGVEDSTVVLKVFSNSQPIAGEDRENIFQPFYRIANGGGLNEATGTGLGLPYARSLAELHKGTLFLEEDAGDGNTFVLRLPLLRTEDPVEDTYPDVQETKNSPDALRHTLLIVEDDRNMRHFLAKELSDEYNVITAVNGREAVDVLNKEKIDLVISDIMMPEMDGNELCAYIKNNVEVSHIPIILVTAVVGVDTRIETLKLGADGYIEKPFSIDLIKVNIANLFRNKEISYYQFANSPLSHFSSVVQNNIDQDFMDKLHSLVMRNISDENLNYEMLVSQMGTSKSTLYRKIKTYTGLNPGDYIRLSRLKKAAEMLATNEYRVNEVADLVGFSSPSYFATCFQKQFGIAPSNFVKNLNEK